MSRRASLARLVVLALAAGACGPAVPSRTPEAPPAHEQETELRLEDDVLRTLAAVDRRIALRARITPSEDDLRGVAMGAVLREDPSVVVIDGSIDPFSFDARARGLDAAAKLVIGVRGEGKRALELELLQRLVAEERQRLEEERAMPRSASSLVRAIVETWQPPKDARAAAEADRWLARRLHELRDEMTAASVDPGSSLDVVRARDLDDALDALERILAAPGYTTAMQELTRLREALETAASRPAAKARSEWPKIARSLEAHLGWTGSAEQLIGELDAAEKALRSRADAAIAAAGLTKDALQTYLEKQVFVHEPCVDAVPGSRVRSMAAPPERGPSCHLRHLVANAEDTAQTALALAVMHDHVVVGLWAALVAAGDATIGDAEGRYHLLVPVLPDTRARYERIALARPVAAIGAAETARMLVGRPDPRATARAWSTHGDVPLDIARRELAR